MPTLYVKTTTVSDGSKRYAVKYRRGGSFFPLEHAGTFKTKGDALIRKRVVGEWLAAGLDPKAELARLRVPPVTMAAACEAWVASRRSVSEGTRANYLARVRRIVEGLKVAPAHLTVGDVNAWVTKLEADYKPGTVALFVSTLRQVLDHADVTPNVARDRRVELPRRVRGEVKPPSADEFLTVLQRTNPSYRLVVVVLEQTGMRVSEAVGLTWDDVDRVGCRLRVSAARSKTGRARWVEVGDWLLEVLGAGHPGINRNAAGDGARTRSLPIGAGALYQLSHPGRALAPLRVFPGVTRQKVYMAIRAGCVAANVEPFGPHALRHRRASILHEAMSPARAAERLGHSTDEHLKTYAHVMPVGEVAVQDLLAALG